jgi:two-component system response regulator ArlR
VGLDTEAVDTHVHVQISFLRKKLKLISSIVRIKTIYGAGYMLSISEGED